MVKVVINQDFKDSKNGTLRKAGTTVELTEERVAEIKAVSPKLVTVLGAKQTESNMASEDLKAEAETAKAEAETAKAEVETLTKELTEAKAVIEELRKELADAEKAAKDAKKTTNK